GPLPVQVFVDEARGVGRGRIEAVEGGEVAEGQGEAPTARPYADLEQAQHGPGAAQLVAVHEAGDHRAAAGHARIEMPDAFGPGIARPPGAEVRPGKREARGRHSRIFAKSTIFRYLAVSAARKRSMSTSGGAIVEPASSS